MDDHSRSRVLIVDDMRVNRLILSSLLSSGGIDSDLAEGGAECLRLCRDNKYDLILLDHRMPDLDGVETLVRLKQIFTESGREVPVVCHTTEDASRNINLYKAAGFADVLIKPIDPGELSKILMTYLPEGKDVQKSGSEADEKLNKEISKLPDWLKKVPGINVVSGIRHCETAEDYLDALSVFSGSIEKKASEIEKYQKEENYGIYVARVHSLKSMAAVIGAEELSDDAAKLEDAGHHEDFELIGKETAKLVDDYRKYSEYLAPLNDKEKSGKEESSEELLEITDEQLKDADRAIAEFVSCYDSESIMSTISALKAYRLPEGELKRIERLETALGQCDWEELRNITTEDGRALNG
ncbi:MAG: response regulator [Lachnospiraceae bacterium]|nr:response regulator [Lachnospiraceae bacterium]